METRIALIGIIVEDPDSVQQINAVLHEYGGYIVGRMGLPYREKKGKHHQRGGRCGKQRHKLSFRQAGDASGDQRKTVYSKAGAQ